MKALLAALLGGIAIFVWLFIAHMFTPLGEAGLDYLPKEDAVSAVLTSSIGTAQGMYLFPSGGLTKESTRAEKQTGMQRAMDAMKTQPSGMLIYKPAGTTFNFAKSLTVEFLTDFAIALIAVLLLAQTRMATFAGRLGFVVMIGVLAAIAANVPHWNWYGFTGAYTAANMAIEIIGLFFAGLAIAAVYKPRA